VENYHIISILFCICVLFFNYREIKYANKLQPHVNKNLILATQLVLFVGILIRTISLSYPEGVFADEAIGGYDTWCLANYGVDHHLNPYPVYFRSWGSGQSALYGYFALPFVKLFGLSTPVFRLPMALWSSIAIIIFYWSLRQTQKDTIFIFLITLLVVISPWHIMMSRWALDCNLSPDFMLIGVSFILVLFGNKSSFKKNLIYLFLAFTFFALVAYSYGISWFMLPLFCILIIGYSLWKKKITVGQIFICGVWTILILIPLILFAFLLFSDGEQFQLGPITITELKAGRHHTTTLLGTDQPFLAILSYGKMAARLLFLGDDLLKWNSIRYWGQFYNLLAIPFIIYCFYNYIKRKNFTSIDSIFIIWLISVLPILVLVEPNVNHWNLLWFPLTYFLAKSIYLFVVKYPRKKIITYIAIGLLGVSFCIKYFTTYSQNQSSGFTTGVEEIVSYTSRMDLEKIYYPNHIVYAVTLFYEPINPEQYNKIKKRTGSSAIEYYDYGKYIFHTPSDIIPEPKTAYVISNNDLDNINTTDFEIYRGKYYTVLWTE